ncbi:hypothetical protein A3736_00105 [Erythrobacter sp. HI0063]|uniref:MobA/MobL family protein n=1 Tax=Erythrobacter sp. HI0063 TaxID=1822240 RepID=UPI0007C351D9|nr:MobA/MobL family protein [Erythrobacter sp. HI0063]KZY58445.1 hypothetical protein A3736_00105 [Erythrobacter sp. HI0063]
MRYQPDPAVDTLAQRERELAAFADRSRNLPPLNREAVRQHIKIEGGSVAKARASLAGLVGSLAPHERRVGDDSHITGKVGGKDKKRPARTIWIDDSGHLKRIRYNQPITRPGRPINAQGFTSLHFDFEAINRAHLEYGRSNAQGRKVSPDDHIIYIEREEAAAELLDALKPAAPSGAEDFLEYQERESAVAEAAGEADEKAIFTNIPGSKADRIALFSGLADVEKVERKPSLEIDLSRNSKLTAKICEELAPGRSLAKFNANVAGSKLAVTGADAESIARVIRSLGWRDRRKKDDRVKRKPDQNGVTYDPGKCGHVQFRLVGELPHEIDNAGRVRIIREMCEEFEKRSLPYIAVMHAPGSTNDDRNWHFHLVYHDRPVSIFDGTATTHLSRMDANGKIPPSKIERKTKWLNEPSIQAQVGKWDFQVCGTWITKSRNRRHVYPFVQRKDRSVTRKDFVPSLRKRLCDLTNLELERYGIERRVDPLKHAEAGRKAVPGKKLFAADHANELLGIPTPRGTDNETMQAYQRRDLLEDEDAAIPQRAYVTEEEEETVKRTLSDQAERLSVLSELMSLRRDIAHLRNISHKAGEQVERLLSRPNAMVDRNCKLMLAEHKKSRNHSRKMDALRRQVEHAHDHINGMRDLAGDLFQLPVEAGRHITRLEERLSELELKAGLRIEPVFAIQIDDEKALPLSARAPQGDSETAGRGNRSDDTISNPSRASRQPSKPTPESAAAPTSPSIKAVATQSASKSNTEISERQRERETNARIDVIAEKKVQFDLHPGRLDDGTGVLVATIDPADSQRHDLPTKIILVTQHEKSRLIHIARARQMQSVSSEQPVATGSPPTETREGPPSVAIARDPGTDIAGQSAQSGAPSEQSRSGTSDGTIGTIVDAMPGSEAPKSNETRTSVSRAADATSGGLSKKAIQKQSDRVSLPTGKASGAGDQSSKASSLIGHEVMRSEIPDDTASRDAPAPVLDTAVADLIARAEQRRIVLFPDQSGRLHLHSSDAKAPLVAARLAEPDAQKRLKQIADAQHEELGILAGIAAADPAILVRLKGGIAVADVAASNTTLMKRWADNEEVQLALGQMARLSAPNPHDEAEIVRRRNLFLFLIMGRREAVDEIDQMVDRNLNQDGAVPRREVFPAFPVATAPPAEKQYSVTQLSSPAEAPLAPRKGENSELATDDKASPAAARERDASLAEKTELGRKQQLLAQTTVSGPDFP